MASHDDKPQGGAGVSDPVIGAEVSGYRVKGRLGMGGMGIVYEGEQPMIGKRVAIKVLRHEVAENPEVVERLISEARAVNQVGHRGIIDVFGFGALPDGRQCIVMEYLDGESLETVLKAYEIEKRTLPMHDSLVILEEVLSALSAAHKAGVIHRDLKPSNIFLCRQKDGTQFVKLLDFGIAKLGVLATTPASRASLMVGTPSYMAPEQARGGIVGPGMDLYAIGVLTFELITGRQPFIADSVVSMLMQHATEVPPRMSALRPDVPAELDELVTQLLKKTPEERPATAEEVRARIAAVRTSGQATMQTLAISVDTELVKKVKPLTGSGHDEQRGVLTMFKSSADGKVEAVSVGDTHISSPGLPAVSVAPPAVSRVEVAPSPLTTTADGRLDVLPRSNTPKVVVGVIGALVLGGLGLMLAGPSSSSTPETKPPTAVAPPAAVPSEPVAAPSNAQPSNPSATPNAATPNAATPTPAVPTSAATPETTAAAAATPEAHAETPPPPPAPVKPAASPGETHKPVPAAAPARNGGPLVIIGAALKRAEAHIARAENEGENVAIFKKQLAAVKAKLAKGGLTPPELEDLQIAASRLEQDTSDL